MNQKAGSSGAAVDRQCSQVEPEWTWSGLIKSGVYLLESEFFQG
jgi:hypothetical protein